MSEFDYGNARVRALISRLLPRATMLSLTGVGSVANLLSTLRETVYRGAVEAALVRGSGLDALADVTRRELVGAAGRLRGFYTGRAGAMVGVWSRRFDVFNVKTVLRGVSRGEGPATILMYAIPAGELSPNALAELARAPGVTAVVALLATWRSPLAPPLLALAAERPQATLAERELALDHWWASTAWRVSDERIWRDHLVSEIDSENIVVALRLVGARLDDAQRHTQYVTVPAARHALLAPHLLREAAGAPDLRTAVAKFEATVYAAALAEGLTASARQARAAAFEVALARRRLRLARRQLYRDLLGIGVPLGYMTLKGNEIVNLRLIGHALNIGLAPQRIAERLVMA